jgi:hypothetical protein
MTNADGSTLVTLRSSGFDLRYAVAASAERRETVFDLVVMAPRPSNRKNAKQEKTP